MSQQRSPEQDHRFSPYLSPAVHQLQPVQRPSSMNHSHLTDQRKSSPIHSHPPSNGAVGATPPIKIPNAVQNLRRLKNPSTASLATTIHSEQHPSPRNVQTPPFRQIASSSTLPPPLSTPLNISTPAPTTTADDGNGLSKADRDIFRVNHHVPVTQPTATRAVDGSRGAIQDGNAESFKQVPMQPEAPPFVTSKEQKEKKDKKEDKEQRRKARQAKKVAKGEESPEERAKRKAEKKARKEAREEKRNSVGDSAHMGQESVISSGLSLATLSHLNETYPQSAFHSENGCVLPDSLSVRSKPVDHQSAPGKMGDTSQTRNFPLAFSDSTENPPALLAPRTETLVKPTQDDLCEHPERKTHKRDKKAQLKASDGSHERKKNHHKTKKSTPGQEPGTTTALVTTNASRSPTLSSSPPQHRLGQPCSTIPNPQPMILHQPSPPSHYTPYVSNQHSYSRPSMNYEPQHRPSTDSRPNSKPRVQSTTKQGSYTYLSLAQNDAVATDYSHDCREQTSNTLNSLHGDKHVGVQSENDRCCGWLFGGTNNKYHRYSEVKATGNQGTRGKKARKQVSDEDSDEDCVVM